MIHGESKLAYSLRPAPILPLASICKIPMSFEQSRYLVKTADTAEEFEATLKLRETVFLDEFAGGQSQRLSDLEDRDHEADFLIVKDKNTSEVIACYRLICSRFSSDFASAEEFDLNPLLALSGTKLELSRACIRADKRGSGVILHLLWKGLTQYMQLSGTRFLFGCSSIPCLKLNELVSLYRGLGDNFDASLPIHPRAAYRIVDVEGLLRFSPKTSESAAVPDLPPLLQAYLKAGAKVYGNPAYDEDFGCLDLFTILDLGQAHTPFLQRFITPEAAVL